MAEGESASDSLRVMSDKHAVIRSHLDEAEAELAFKKEQLRSEEERLRLKGGEICVAEQQVRSLNEKIFYLHQEFTLKEKEQQELVTELVETEWNVIKTKEEVQKVKKNRERNMELLEAHKSKVESVSLSQGAQTPAKTKTDAEQLQKEIDHLLSLKTRLEEGDLELKRIWTGEALQTIEVQQAAILEAFGERDIETEVLQAELDDKLEQVKDAEQRIQIDEKQNQARLRLMQKQLQELEETEKHLRSTVEYMQQQVHGVRKE